MTRLRTAEAQALAELAAVMAEGARLSRGRQYLRKNAVGGLDVDVGMVSARVTGSRDDPYDVTLACRPATDNEREASRSDLTAAVPGVLDVVFDCHCPDWGDPCKHGIALLLAFAAEVDDDPSQLLVWRGIDDVTPPPPEGTESLTMVPEDRIDRPRMEPRRDSPVSAAGTRSEPAVAEALVSSEPSGYGGGALEEFFCGTMPAEATESLLRPLEEIQLDAFGGARIVIETVDMAPVFADAMEKIADHWLSH